MKHFTWHHREGPFPSIACLLRVRASTVVYYARISRRPASCCLSCVRARANRPTDRPTDRPTRTRAIVLRRSVCCLARCSLTRYTLKWPTLITLRPPLKYLPSCGMEWMLRLASSKYRTCTISPCAEKAYHGTTYSIVCAGRKPQIGNKRWKLDIVVVHVS